jgi:hypothetical protein
MEVGNNVFMSYKKVAEGQFEELAQKNVDHGSGLERIAAAALNDPDMFKISVMWPIIEKLQAISGKNYESHTESMRVIADHLRAATFLAVDGCTPSNKEQGYVMRRLVRRAIRYSFDLGIEQPSERPANAIGRERLLQGLRLEQHGKAGEGALCHRCRAERSQRRPKMFLGRWINRHALGGQDCLKPFSSPVTLGRLIDPRQGLQLHRTRAVVGKAGSQILPVAAAGERCRPDRAPEIEGEDLRAVIPPELQRHQREQDRFARSGRPDNQRVTDIADV